MRQPRNFATDRYYHLVSRIANRAFYLSEEERTRFVERMWRVPMEWQWYNADV